MANTREYYSSSLSNELPHVGLSIQLGFISVNYYFRALTPAENTSLRTGFSVQTTW